MNEQQNGVRPGEGLDFPAIGDLAVCDLNAIPRRIKYVGETEVYVEDEHHVLGGEWLPLSFVEPYTVWRGSTDVPALIAALREARQEIASSVSALEQLLVATYTGDGYEAAQEAAQGVLDDTVPGWSNKYE